MRMKPRLYYGWWIVLSAFVTVGITHGLRTYTFGVFVRPLSEDLGWSRAAIAGVITATAVWGGILGPFVGRHVDRHGPRGSMVVGAIVAGLALIAISGVDSLWQWYLLWLVFMAGDALAGMVPNNTAIANWFVKKRGEAMGVAYVAVSLGGLILVPATTAIVATAGWRWGFVFLGTLMACIMAPTSGLIMRRRPEDLGLLPDGARPGTAVTGDRAPRSRTEEPAWTLRQAIRTAPFWLVALATGFGGAMASIGSVHAMAFAMDLGISPAAAAGAIGLLLLVSMPGRFVYAWLCDRMDIRYVMMIYLTGLLASALVLSQMRSLAMLYISMVIFGLSVGGVNPVPPVMAAHLYGRKNVGRIWGTVYFLSMPLTASASVLAGYIYDTTGSYQLAFYIAAVGLAVSIVGMYFARLRAAGVTTGAPVIAGGGGPR